ncbi:imidazole glycerol phosphate synthase subunit HisF [Bacillus sp. V3-13]|uniref:AglZ/HisF2 family acetamidino modification protein n=1 Tax=Bacillus sp. V3-13 TaxID=2053728 RepID=UPI000C7873BD|nr:AglZ/HisF2 family acetamidino modification protein [Bacillus sp. V3-13]PLR76026.1 imidazole glycerol phosphate synthase subunit HisF [Bacillus sp. V3-13]
MYHRPRLIPCLTIQDRGLVKTTKFSNPRYLGDPVNAVKIFNGKGVDELCILDITATSENRGPDFEYLKDIASEAFMPLSYGGGITTLTEIEKLFYIGYEKVIINTSFILNPQLIKDAAELAGSQSVVVSIDVKNELFGKRYCYINGGSIKAKEDPVTLAKKAEELGAGEILLNSITYDGTMKGYDLELVKSITAAVSIPVIACGGAKDIIDFKKVLEKGGAHAAAAGSLFVYYGSHKAVLITAPEENDLVEIGVYKM